MPDLALHFFGSPRIECDGIATHVGRRKSMALLAYLAVTDQPHGRDVLADLLWPDLRQGRARAMLRQALSTLNQAIGKRWLISDADQLDLPSQPGLWVDTVHFRRLLVQVVGHHPSTGFLCDACVDALTGAVNLHTGGFLAGFSLSDAPDFEAWQFHQRETLRQELSTAFARLVHVHGEAGRRRYDLALAYARRWLDLDPLHEPAHRTLMQLYAQTGDRTAAVHQFEECVRLLDEELGVKPESETVALFETIRQGDGLPDAAPLADAQAPGSPQILQSAGYAVWEGEPLVSHNNLPAQSTHFIGRARELAQVAGRLADPECRLLTVVGPGGIGKTRLALEAAKVQIGAYSHGVHYVDLAPVDSAGLLATTILRSLDVPGFGAAAPLQRLCDFLRPRQMLLLLDNFEHLLGAADLLPEILHAAPGIKLLVTSRERLNLREEWLEPLEGLESPLTAGPGTLNGLPTEQEPAPDLEAYDATNLFLHCMRRLQPDRTLSEQEALSVAAICRLLEGMPLGIELAAAWAHTLPLEEAPREMQRSLSFLSTSLHNMPARHRSMRAVFDHSWQLLSEPEQHMLRCLSVFRGGCTRAAAMEVARASLADLSRLVDRSWLRLRSTGRYEMHELVRQYCGERLAGEHAQASDETPEAVRRRHCTYIHTSLHDSVQNTNYRREVIHHIMAEFGNVQAAWRCAADTVDVQAAHDICFAIFFAGDMMGWYRFSIQTLEEAAIELEERSAQPEIDQKARADMAHILANIRHTQGSQYLSLGLLENASTCIDQLRALAEGMEPGVARTYWYLLSFKVQGWVTAAMGDFETTRTLAQWLLTQFQDEKFTCLLYGDRIGPLFWQAEAHYALGLMNWSLGAYAQAEQMFERCMALRDEIGEQRFRAVNLAHYARLAQTVGNMDRAEEAARQGLHLSQEFGDHVGTAWGHLALGRALSMQEQAGRARAHLKQCLEMARRSGQLRLLMDSLAELGRIELAEGNIQQAKRFFEQAVDAFATVETAHTNSLIAVWLGLGWTAIADEDPAEATSMFRKALASCGRLAVETMEAIAGMGRVWALEGRVPEAIELFELVAYHPFTAHALREQARQTLRDLGQNMREERRDEQTAAATRRRLDETLAALTGVPTG